MELQEITLEGFSRSSIIEVIGFGDLHMGTLNCDIPAIKRTVRYILNTDGCFWVGMGDQWECIPPNDPRFDSETLPRRHLEMQAQIPESEKEEYLEIVEPILTPADEGGKCLGIHKGNHEYSLLKHYHRDLVYEICRDYGLRDLGAMAMSRLIFRRHRSSDTRALIVHSQHGHGGGRKRGSKVNLLNELPGKFDADVYYMGHVHTIDCSEMVTIKMKDKACEEWARERVAATTGCYYRTYIEGTTNYAEKASYDPVPIGSVKASFKPWAREDRLHIEKLWIN